MIKFNLYNVTDTETKAKAKVSYSVDSHISGKPCVTLYAKGYGNELSKFFSNVCNDSDIMTDYFCKDSVRFFEGDFHYSAARAAAEKLQAKQDAAFEKKYGASRKELAARQAATYAAI